MVSSSQLSNSKAWTLCLHPVARITGQAFQSGGRLSVYSWGFHNQSSRVWLSPWACSSEQALSLKMSFFKPGHNLLVHILWPQSSHSNSIHKANFSPRVSSDNNRNKSYLSQWTPLDTAKSKVRREEIFPSSHKPEWENSDLSLLFLVSKSMLINCS